MTVILTNTMCKTGHDVLVFSDPPRRAFGTIFTRLHGPCTEAESEKREAEERTLCQRIGLPRVERTLRLRYSYSFFQCTVPPTRLSPQSLSRNYRITPRSTTESGPNGDPEKVDFL